ncbi:unnamed protein product [Candidula unifasciata]|uniref:Uncharacterized protein n=1 Tax=Candidula unifasciata TaxID=100452 RepID=A0A8S3Z7K3_9EUPU|nr:unnamed protein product [Candidula unifasciata]
MGRNTSYDEPTGEATSVHTVTELPTSTPASYVEDSVLIMSLDTEDAKESIINLYKNNSKIISDLPQYMGAPYTPLTAPELDLVNVEGYNLTNGGHVLYLYSSRTDELAWLIPAVFIGTVIFFIIVYVSFYGVKNLEVKVMMCYFILRGCCRQDRGQSSNEEMEALTSNMALAPLELSAYQTTRSPRETDNFIL